MRYVIAVLALVGAVVSGLALQVHYTAGHHAMLDQREVGLRRRQPQLLLHDSRHSGGDYWDRRVPRLVWLGLARQRAVLTLAAVVGLAFSLYLAHVERDILGVWCLYCVISLADIALIMLLGFIWLIVDAIQRQRRRW